MADAFGFEAALAMIGFGAAPVRIGIPMEQLGVIGVSWRSLAAERVERQDVVQVGGRGI